MYKNTRKANKNKNKNNNKNKSIKKNINAKMIGGTGGDAAEVASAEDALSGTPVPGLRVALGAADQRQAVDAGLPPKNTRQAKDTALPVSSPDTISPKTLKAIYNSGIKLEQSTADSFILTFGDRKEPEPQFSNIHHLSLYLSVCNDLSFASELNEKKISDIIVFLEGKIEAFNKQNETTTNPGDRQLAAPTSSPGVQLPDTYEDEDA